MPDLPDPAFRRVLAGPEGGLNAVAIAPDGTWLATGSDLFSSRTVRIWDTASWTQKTAPAGVPACPQDLCDVQHEHPGAICTAQRDTVGISPTP